MVTQWTEAVERDRSHPCVVAWVPFNESTGVLSLPGREEQRHYVEAVALLTKALDPTRLVVANDGWEALGGDLVGIHDYESLPERLRDRYAPDLLEQTLRGFGNNGRIQVLDDPARARPSAAGGTRAVVLSEFGGIGFARAGRPRSAGAGCPSPTTSPTTGCTSPPRGATPPSPTRRSWSAATPPWWPWSPP